jgi:ankyrin repeat protein
MFTRLAIGTILFAMLAVSPPAQAGALHDAAKAGELEQVKALLDKGADPEARDNNGESPLNWAALAGHRKVAELLIERGAAVDGRNNGGFMALHAAALRGHLALVDLLATAAVVNDRNNRAMTSALHLAAEENHLAVGRLLVERGAELDYEDGNGHTATTQAVLRLHGDMVDLLRGLGAGCQSEAVLGEKYHDYCLAHGG